MENKLISIVLPTWKEARYINRTIDSILVQSFPNWELIIIDDGLYDTKINEIQSYINKDRRITLLKNENNLGIQKTLNNGLMEAKGKYVARIDDDDEWIDKDKLKKQFEFLQLNKDYVLVGTGIVVANEDGSELFRYLPPEKDQSIRNKLLSKNCFVHSSVLFNREIALKAGGYPEDVTFKHVEDYYLWLKVGLVGKMYNLPIYATKYTQRANSISSDNKLDQFKKDIFLIKKFKNKYPNYYISIIFGYVRFFMYKLFKLIAPNYIKFNLVKFYKKF